MASGALDLLPRYGASGLIKIEIYEHGSASNFDISSRRFWIFDCIIVSAFCMLMNLQFVFVFSAFHLPPLDNVVTEDFRNSFSMLDS